MQEEDLERTKKLQAFKQNKRVPAGGGIRSPRSVRSGGGGAVVLSWSRPSFDENNASVGTREIYFPKWGKLHRYIVFSDEFIIV